MLFCWLISLKHNTNNQSKTYRTECQLRSSTINLTIPNSSSCLLGEREVIVKQWSQCLPGTSLLQIQDPSFVYCLSRNQNAYILKSLDFDLPTFQTKQSHRHEFIPTKKWYPMKASKSIYPTNHSKTNQQKHHYSIHCTESPSRSFWLDNRVPNINPIAPLDSPDPVRWDVDVRPRDSERTPRN